MGAAGGYHMEIITFILCTESGQGVVKPPQPCWRSERCLMCGAKNEIQGCSMLVFRMEKQGLEKGKAETPLEEMGYKSPFSGLALAVIPEQELSCRNSVWR